MTDELASDVGDPTLPVDAAPPAVPDGASAARSADAMRVVLELTAELSQVHDLTAIADVVATSVVSRLGASAGFVALASDDGSALEMLSHVRAGLETVQRCRLDGDALLPVVDAWRFGPAVLMHDRDELFGRYPDLDQSRDDRHALAALPLEVDGRRLGAVNLTFAEPQAFDDEQQLVLKAISAVCAQALRRAMLLDEIERVRRDFVVTASHELRTPLAAIYGAAVTLRAPELQLGEQQREALTDLIVSQSERMTAVVDDLRFTAFLDAGQVELEVEPTDLVAVVADATVTWLDPRPSVGRLQVVVSDELPRALADPLRLQQVVSNLVDNAHKYAPGSSPIEIRLELDDTEVCITVQDSGPGMSPNDRERAFEKFYRADATHRNGVSGTGLGLYICRQLTIAMGGKLRLGVPPEGTGTVAEIRLPAA